MLLQTLVVVLGVLGRSFAKTPLERAAEMVAQMNTTEKIAMMHGRPGTYVGNIIGNERLGIPKINMNDGPQGFRTSSRTGGDGTTTAWPSALTISSSFDTSLMYSWAKAMGEEFRDKGANVALAPGIGIARVANAGRNFEYLCGEDPILGANMAVNVINGIQDVGVIANAKHWVNNEIEDQRKQVSANVDERVRFELYYPPFQASVDAGVLSVMCAYNRINNVYACENNETLSHLKSTMGFNGWVMSDWTATHSTAASVNAGLDQEMPFGIYFSNYALEKALDSGDISIDSINNSVQRILTSMFEIGMFDSEPVGNPKANVTSDAHNQLARDIAATSTVLAKNDGALLPLSKTGLGSCIAVFGDETTVSGGGSGHVNPAYIVTPTQGIKSALAGVADSTEVIYNAGTDMTQVTSLAKQCGTSVVVVATTSSEGSDRTTLALDGNQDTLVTTVLAANPTRTVVAVRSPGAVLMPWAATAPAILLTWLPGQEAGNALADVLFGNVNPSARTPVTMPNKDNEVGFTEEEYPGVGHPPQASYLEELLIGYRWYDANNVKPVFPFGHGLSYTSFAYSGVHVEPSKDFKRHSLVQNLDKAALDTVVAQVTATVKNIGPVAGTEVMQLYLSFPESAGEPPKQLKYFSKVALNTNQAYTTNFRINQRDISVWDSVAHAWAPVKGEFKVLIGASSADIRLQSTFTVA